MSETTIQLLVIGAGPGGYPAAFHAADRGLKVILVDRDPEPGGVCLFRGCIPSKAILHAAHVLEAAREAPAMGITFPEPVIDIPALRTWKESIVRQLTGGLGQLTRARGITFIQGEAAITGPHSATIRTAGGETRTVQFDNAIVATGSEPVRASFLPDLPGIMDSTAALALDALPESLLVIGGGYIGLELGQAYASLGTRVSVVEATATLLPGVDPDLVKPLAAHLKTRFAAIQLGTRVTGVQPDAGGFRVTLEGPDHPPEARFDRVLVAIGRRPVTAGAGLETAGIHVDAKGFITVNDRRRTSCDSIYAVGDVAGQPMLAHKATHEGRLAVEAILNGKAVYEPRAIPAVVFTDPEIAWCGLTEDEARRQGLDIRVAVFPWQASGRAATLSRREGITKIIADPEGGRILGVGISGTGAGELIGEGVLAIEMGAVAEDLALTIHAHPSLSETLMEAAQRLMGQSTHYFQRL